MPKAAVILVGRGRTRKLALEMFATLGTPDVSTLTSAYMPGVEIDGRYYTIPSTRYTAEVEPNQENKELAYGR